VGADKKKPGGIFFKKKLFRERFYTPVYYSGGEKKVFHGKNILPEKYMKVGGTPPGVYKNKGGCGRAILK